MPIHANILCFLSLVFFISNTWIILISHTEVNSECQLLLTYRLIYAIAHVLQELGRRHPKLFSVRNFGAKENKKKSFYQTAILTEAWMWNPVHSSGLAFKLDERCIKILNINVYNSWKHHRINRDSFWWGRICARWHSSLITWVHFSLPPFCHILCAVLVENLDDTAACNVTCISLRI